jgi:hypothetical protein
MEKELSLLEAGKLDKLKKKYLLKKDKFLSLVQKTHLLLSDFEYDAKRKGMISFASVVMFRGTLLNYTS